MNLLGVLWFLLVFPTWPHLSRKSWDGKGAMVWQIQRALWQVWGHQGVLQNSQEPSFVLRQQCCKLCPVCHTCGWQGLQRESTTSIWAARGDLPACPQCLRVPKQRAAILPRDSPHMLHSSDIYWSLTCDGASDQSVSFPYTGCKGWQMSFFVLLFWMRENKKNPEKKRMTSEGDNLLEMFYKAQKFWMVPCHGLGVSCRCSCQGSKHNQWWDTSGKGHGSYQLGLAK